MYLEFTKLKPGPKCAYCNRETANGTANTIGVNVKYEYRYIQNHTPVKNYTSTKTATFNYLLLEGFVLGGFHSQNARTMPWKARAGSPESDTYENGVSHCPSTAPASLNASSWIEIVRTTSGK